MKTAKPHRIRTEHHYQLQYQYGKKWFEHHTCSCMRDARKSLAYYPLVTGMTFRIVRVNTTSTYTVVR